MKKKIDHQRFLTRSFIFFIQVMHKYIRDPNHKERGTRGTEQRGSNTRPRPTNSPNF